MHLLTPRSVRWMATLGLVTLSFAASTSRAQVWNEVGDAGALIGTAQTTVGTSPLTTILGVLGTNEDVDVYCVQLGMTPSALGIPAVSLLCASDSEPDLWVFDANGLGVTTNNLCLGASSAVTTAYFPTPGTYYIAVAFAGAVPQSAGGAMWLPAGLGERSPDGPGAASALVGWSGGSVPLPGFAYQLTLSFMGPCGGATPATRPSWGALRLRYR